MSLSPGFGSVTMALSEICWAGSPGATRSWVGLSCGGCCPSPSTMTLRLSLLFKACGSSMD